MRSSLAFTPILASLTLAAASHGLPELTISKRDAHNGGSSNHFARSIPARFNIEKRQDTVGTNIFNVLSWSSGGAYYANITVGTPPQDQTVILDTGSSDLYFDASGASTCKTTGPNTCKGGTFDASKSTTYKEAYPAPAFNTSFGDGSTAVGPYGHDIVGIGNVLVQPVQFGVANEVTSTTGYAIGLMGLGYSTNEAVTDENNFYQNMPEVLKDAGVINSRLYSVFLNDALATSGSILFGGIDKSKYTGDLATVNLLPAVYQGQVLPVVNQFITTVTAASVTVGGQTTELWSGGSDGLEAYGRTDAALPVLLDTGSTAWSVPASYYREYILPSFPYIDRQGLTSCANANSGDSVTLEFAGKISIKIDARQFIVPLVNSTTRETYIYNEAGDEACVFLIQEAQSDGMGFQTLGDAILRSMYVVFDLDNGQASIAQAAVNTTASPDVVVVEAGADGVAKAVGSGINTAPANTESIAPEVQAATSSFIVSTAATTIGTATGEAAVPQDAQTEGEAGSASSSAAATAFSIPGHDFTAFWIAGLWITGMAIGATVML